MLLVTQGHWTRFKWLKHGYGHSSSCYSFIKSRKYCNIIGREVFGILHVHYGMITKFQTISSPISALASRTGECRGTCMASASSPVGCGVYVRGMVGSAATKWVAFLVLKCLCFHWSGSECNKMGGIVVSKRSAHRLPCSHTLNALIRPLHFRHSLIGANWALCGFSVGYLVQQHMNLLSQFQEFANF